MSAERSAESWLQDNDRYLAAALGWLRARLEHLADVAQGQRRVLTSTDRPASTSDTAAAAPTPPALGAAGPAAADAPSIPEEMKEAQSAQHPPALLLLSQRLGLSEFERYTLLLCAAMEFDTRIGALCARAQQDAARPYPTFALALSLFDEPAWEVMSPDRPLRYWRLVEVSHSATEPLIASVLRADERIVNYLKGLNYLDDRLVPLMKPVAQDDTTVPPSQAQHASDIVDAVRGRNNFTLLPAIQLSGPDSQSKLIVARHAAGQLGRLLYRMPAEALAASASDHEMFVRLWQRESALMAIALYVDASQLDRVQQQAPMHRLIGSRLGLLFLDVHEPWPDPMNDGMSFEIAKPTPAEQHAVWLGVLGADRAEDTARLAAQFSFNLPTIHAVAAQAHADADDRSGEHAWRESLRRTRPALDQLAQRLEPKATWKDLELPAAERKLLEQIVAQVRARGVVYDQWGFRERMNRGFGVSVLFAGESGTGKTMAAEVIANALELLLYRIDLSAVVSKYIGETEKNLRKLFDAAEQGGAILFFDEADALFGKRSEVKDSHDRYANIEINYLLQRMEAYRGLAVLATNMKSALDTAFLRRLRFIVNFPFPGVAERKAIWQKAFPDAAPLAKIDYDRLARLNLTGGNIHNIAINAAFLAASAATRVTMPLVMEAARGEYRKIDKPINETEFRWVERAEAK
jgi:hypothetical protein